MAFGVCLCVCVVLAVYTGCVALPWWALKRQELWLVGSLGGPADLGKHFLVT